MKRSVVRFPFPEEVHEKSDGATFDYRYRADDDKQATGTAAPMTMSIQDLFQASAGEDLAERYLVQLHLDEYSISYFVALHHSSIAIRWPRPRR